MHQLFSFGKFLDNCPRTQNDLNEYRIDGDTAIFDLYSGLTSEKISEFIIDKEDIPKIKYHKWRMCHDHVVTGLPAKGTQRELSWIVLGLDNRNPENIGVVVDHISGNAKDNRKSNLRICTQSENTLNKSFMKRNTSGFIGVSYKSDKDRWDGEIRFGDKRCHLGYERELKDAVYKRMIAEKLVFKEYANEIEQKKKYDFTYDLPTDRKKELEEITKKKLIAKGLWQ